MGTLRAGMRSNNGGAESRAASIDLDQEAVMNGIVYLVGLVVVVLAVLSFVGLR